MEQTHHNELIYSISSLCDELKVEIRKEPINPLHVSALCAKIKLQAEGLLQSLPQQPAKD